MKEQEEKKEVILKVKILAGSSKTEIVGWEGDHLKIRVAAPPEKGKANQALIAFLSKHFGVPKSAITIISGETSRIKKLRIKGITQQHLKRE